MAVTTSSGPGIALKHEAIGLAVMTELPLLIINVQRGGPSTGLPTKTEQADLLQAMFGRNGECPVPVVAARSPADCFDAVQEAWRIAVALHDARSFLLTDGYIANGSEPWQVPDVEELAADRGASTRAPMSNGDVFHPYARDERLARPWALPGTPGLMHRIGGLEKQDITGNVNYEPANHQHMVDLRAKKVANIALDIPPQAVDGPGQGASCSCSSVGRHLRRLRHGRARSAGQGGLGRPCPSALLEPVPGRTWASCSRTTKRF